MAKVPTRPPGSTRKPVGRDPKHIPTRPPGSTRTVGPPRPRTSYTLAKPVGVRSFALAASPKKPSWRRRYRRGSFKGVFFYVEQQGRSSGRRTVTFEYPKRDIPFAEDMGRQALRYQMTAYLIQAPKNPTSTRDEDIQYGEMWRDYDVQRDLLERALMSPGPGVLRDPYNPDLNLPGYNGLPLTFMCERYSIIEERQKGGFCTIEMSFVEAGIPGNNFADEFTAAAVALAALRVVQQSAIQLKNRIDSIPNIMTFEQWQQLNQQIQQGTPPFQFK